MIVGTKTQTARLAALQLRANTVSSAAVKTRLLPDFISAFDSRATSGAALTGRAGRPEEIAEVLVFLTKPESGWIRGSNLIVDGGLDARLACAELSIEAV